MGKKSKSKDAGAQQSLVADEQKAPEAPKYKNPKQNTVQNFVATAEEAGIMPTDGQRAAANAVYSAGAGVTTTIAVMALNDVDFEETYAALKGKRAKSLSLLP